MMREKGGVLGGENLASREQEDAPESLNEVGLLLRQQGDGKLPVGNRRLNTPPHQASARQ
jgi:hypothetical protein